MPNRVVRIDVYVRRRGHAGSSYRFLLSEPPVSGRDPLAAARETIAELSRQFPANEYKLVSRLDHGSMPEMDLE